MFLTRVVEMSLLHMVVILLEHAVTCCHLVFLQAIAEQEGNIDEAEKLKEQLDALEERAEELDRIRTGNISAISYINQRNRQRNILEAEKAVIVSTES